MISFNFHRFAARLLTAVFSLSLLLSGISACGSGDSEEKITLNIMCWNDDFREMMETYFIPRNEKLMANVEICWINGEISTYADDVEQRLDAGEVIDIFVGNDEMAVDFANNENTAALSALGINDEDLSEQYAYTRALASDESGVQKGAAITAEPGVIVYRTDYAEKYLGVTDPSEMQEMLSSWDSFLETAQKLNRASNGTVSMITNSSELWKAVEAEMMGNWVSDGQLSVSDETLTQWLDYINALEECDAFGGVSVMRDEWYNSVGSGVFCFFTAPWLNKNISSSSAEIKTLYYAAQEEGTMGLWKAVSAPYGFVYGGNWLFSSANSPNSELVGEIIKAFTCDGEFMKLLALGDMSYVNNTEVAAELAEVNIDNPMLDGQDAFSVYIDAAEGLDIETPSVYDSAISDILYYQAVSYKNGNVTLEEALYNFHYRVWEKYGGITQEPEPLEDDEDSVEGAEGDEAEDGSEDGGSYESDETGGE